MEDGGGSEGSPLLAGVSFADSQRDLPGLTHSQAGGRISWGDRPRGLLTLGFFLL